MEPESVPLDGLQAMAAPDLLRWAFETHGHRAAIGTSLQKSGVVMIDLASRIGLPFRVFFIDTLLDFPETYDLYDRLQERYGIRIERFIPDRKDTEPLRRNLGQWEHYFDRQACCFVRKTLPLKRAQGTLDVWISGVRADQSAHREEHAAKAEFAWDAEGRRILKLNPLLDWTLEDVDAYIREHDVPYNALYDFVSPYGERFHVISCQRCHIPTRDDFDRRAGKWPWESAGKKECGLHEHGGGI